MAAEKIECRVPTRAELIAMLNEKPDTVCRLAALQMEKDCLKLHDLQLKIAGRDKLIADMRWRIKVLERELENA